MNTYILSLDTKLHIYLYSGLLERFRYPYRTYKEWGLLTAEKGSFRYTIGEETGEVKVGEAVLCPPNVTLHRATDSPIAFHFIRFHVKATDLHGNQIDFPYHGKLLFRNSSRFLSSLVSMRHSLESNSYHYINHLLNDILYQYIEENTYHKRNEMPKDPSIIEALRYINENASTSISMNFVSSHVGLSQSQFTRKFQKEVGVNPIKYLTTLRIQKAKSLLVETEDSLEDIALQCGYQSAFYLSRVFLRETSINPSEYRKAYRV
ncbi:helix-turn-helix domain-containing protein [Paenibacillus chungangensis]|uniref:Helix-turn-helix domain-containing protein n=1 Tax=Paenibacillus chungangensis TaxID=696535 RepID=A0ABW3HLJ4_9BACL